MQEAVNFLYLINDVVLRPDLTSALVIFIFSLANELLVVIPYALILSGQLLFLQDGMSVPLMAKLLVFVAVPVGLGSTLGTMPYYVLAYFGGKPAVEKYHAHIHFAWKDIEKINARFKGFWHDEIIFLFLRTVPILPSLPLTLVGGFFRMRFLPFFVLTFVGLTVRMMFTLIMVGIGVGSLSELMLLIYNN